MSKHYRVIKEHPLWEVGAILTNEHGGYKAVDDFWTKEIKGISDTSDYTEGEDLVEHQTEFFERVYKVNILKQVQYVSKEKAKDIHKKLYKEK